MVRTFTIAFVLLITFISCDNKDKITLVESTGRINHLLVVMNDDDWQGEIGDTLRTVLAEPLIGLPQDEAQFYVNQVTQKNFTKLFNRNRNILFVGFSDENNFYENQDVYSSPQTILTVLGKDKEELIKNILENKKEIIRTYKKRDLALYQRKVTKKHWKPEKIKTLSNLGVSLRIPQTYNKVEDTGDFVWYRYTFTKGQLNIITYAIPLESDNTFSPRKIIKVRDSIGRKYIPGQFENTHMLTERLYQPHFIKMKLDSKETIETRGLWLMKNDYMGGPFLSYTLLDKPNNRMIIAEGFSFSPATKKRDFVFEMEAILKTIHIN